MRILEVAPFFSPQLGGSPQAVYHISRELANRGHAVTVIAGDYRIKNASFPSQAFNVVILPSPISSMGFYITPGLIPWIRKHIYDFDIIHLHEFRTFQNIVVRWFAIRANVPFVLSAHGTLPVIVQRQFFKKVYDLLFGRAILASARCLVAVSPMESQQYLQVGIEEKRIKVIYNGLDLDEFDTLAPHGTFRKSIQGLEEKSKVILYMGRLHRRKGINFLIEAFAQLTNDPIKSQLVIIGPDEGELSRLQALTQRLGLQDRVRFVGPRYGSIRLSALEDADVLAYPAEHEIFGLVPFEALLCGTPVITADDCGQGQIIRAAGAGYLVPYGNVNALTEALSHVLLHPEEANQKVELGQRFIRERMNWKNIVIELENLYRSLAENQP